MEKVLIKFIMTVCIAIYSMHALAEEAIKIPLQTSLISLDPSHIQDMPSLFVSRQINCQLVRNNGSVFQYDAAKIIKYISPLEIVITLSDAVKFNDGSPVTAADVVASFEYIKKSRNVMRNIFLWVDKIIVKDNHTIVFFLKKPIPQFFKVLSSPNYAIFKKSFIDSAIKNSDLWKNPIGCGDYKITASNKNIIRLTPIKNSLPIEFHLTKTNQLLAEDIYKYDIINLNIKGGSEKLSAYEKIGLFDPSQIYIGLNTNHKEWRDRDKRCAFMAKIKNSIILEEYAGMAKEANDFLPAGTLGYSSSAQYFSALKNQYEHNETPKIDKFCLSYLSLSIPEKFRQLYFNMINDIYPNMETRAITDAKQFGSKFSQSKCDAIIFSLKSNYLDGFEYLQIFANNDANFSGYKDRNMASDIMSSQNNDNAYERSKHYRQIIKKIEHACLITPIVTIPMRTIYVKKTLVTPGIGLGALNEYPLSQVSVR
tara:strand:- start:1063 stop:2508 length:1446 start_codon:yes stop_codon:yes gene_type:complete